MAIVLFCVACSHSSDVVLTVHRDVKAMNIRGGELYLKGDYKGATESFDRARLLAVSIDDRAGEAESLNNLGRLYLEAVDFACASEKFSAALSINEAIVNDKGAGANLNNLGNLHIATGDLEAARAELERAAGIFKNAGDKLGHAEVQNSLGLLAMKEGDAQRARALFGAALKVAKDEKRHRLVSACLVNLGAMEESEGDLFEAASYYQSALDEDRLSEYSIGIAGDLVLLGRVHSLMGRNSKAQDALRRAFVIHTKLGFEREMKDDLNALIALAKSQGDKAMSLEYQKKLKALGKK